MDAIRKRLRLEGADGFILSNGDEFFSEYPPEHEKRLEWLTGFSGTAGTVVVLDHEQPSHSAFFTDGRYILQAKQEIDESLYQIHNISDITPLQWLKKNAASDTIAFDPWLISANQLRNWREQAHNIMWTPIRPNLVNKLWDDRPAPTNKPAFEYPIEYAGKSRAEKLDIIIQELKNNDASAVLLCQPESVNWLINIRGHDIKHTPILLCRAIVSVDGEISFYADKNKLPKKLLDGVNLYPVDSIRKHCKRWGKRSILLQPSATPVRLYRLLKSSGAEIIEKQDPCTLPKSLKNNVELSNIRKTHLTDGLALTKFLHWLDTKEGSVTELSAAQQLEDFRKESPDYIEPSFPTISGFGENGAIVHYSVDEKSSLQFTDNNLYLVDSGGQYMGGTTDVTRTIAIGEPTNEMRENYTRVLQGHIAISTAIFPKGTNGNQLDALARQSLWQAGLDYDHGTSHGVGCYMSVHEGPQSISKRSTGVALQAGMIISNEPGYYKTGEYGIRIESLVEIIEAEKDGFLTFNNLTCAPLDRRLVAKDMLNDKEVNWLNNYHQWVLDNLRDSFESDAREWLENACQPIVV